LCPFCRWLTREHPDPNAFHLGKLRKALVTLNHAAIAGRDGREGGGEGGDGGLRYSALFMDFMCCPQRDANGHKTEAEVAVFNHCITAMGAIYASPRTLVLQEKQLPPDVAAGMVSYDGSGWCNFEQAVARLCHRGESVKVLEIGVEGHEEGEALVSRMSAQWTGCEPPSLDEMEDLFLSEDRTYFFGNADRQLVTQMYREFAEKVVEWEWDNMPLCIKSGEARTRRQFAHCRRYLIVMGSASIIFTSVGMLGMLTMGPPIYAFVFWGVLLLAWAILLSFHQWLLCVAPTYRSRWWSCLTRAWRCEGLSNGPDLPDVKRSIVYQRSSLERRRAMRSDATAGGEDINTAEAAVLEQQTPLPSPDEVGVGIQ